MSGEIPDGGMLDVLREIEARRISGRLRFTTGGKSGTVAVVAGQIALDQESMEDGSDPVEVVLKARSGHYVVHQRLPSLPVSHGDDDHRNGSLQVHVPADLMNYCEQSGVTGTLKLVREGNLAELVYDAGELLAIRLDGKEDADLSAVFAWDEGSFDIKVGKDVQALVPGSIRAPEPEDPSEREPTTQFVRPRHEDTGQHFLKVVEVALTDVVATRERVRPKARTSPPRAPVPSIRPPAAMPKMAAPKPKRREHTVRIAYLAGDDESALAAIDQVARQAAGGRTPEVVHMETRHDDPPSGEEPLPEEPKKAKKSDPPPKARRASDDEKSDDARDEAPAAAKAVAPGTPVDPADGGLGPIGWAVVAIAAGVAAYYLLSHLLAAS
jgi:hypothetical protein